MSGTAIGKTAFLLILLAGTAALVVMNIDRGYAPPMANVARAPSEDTIEFRLGGDRGLADEMVGAHRESERLRQLAEQQRIALRRDDRGDAGRPRSDGAPPPNGRIHVLQEGETLSSVAYQYYGKGRQWPRIAQANNLTQRQIASLPTGTRLIIPNVRPAPSRSGPDTRDPRFRPHTTDPSGSNADPRPAPRQYTVRRGDTLFAIARTSLGDGNKWRAIRDLNRERIPDPSRLVPGTILTLP